MEGMSKLYSELSGFDEFKEILQDIQSIINYTNEEGYSEGILEAVIDILNAEIVKEKRRNPK